MPEHAEDEQENNKQDGNENEADYAGDQTDRRGPNQGAAHKNLIVAAGYSLEPVNLWLASEMGASSVSLPHSTATKRECLSGTDKSEPEQALVWEKHPSLF
jgi:hypothetical protein